MTFHAHRSPPVTYKTFRIWPGQHRDGRPGFHYARVGANAGPLDLFDPDFGFRPTLAGAKACVDEMDPPVKAQ